MSKLYIKLFHGRSSPTEDLDDWGTDGPVFGPLSFVHLTYMHTINLGDSLYPFDTIAELEIFGDLVYYDGFYYGDWSVFGEDQLNVNTKLKKLRQEIDLDKLKIPDNLPPTVIQLTVDDGKAIQELLNRYKAELEERVSMDDMGVENSNLDEDQKDIEYIEQISALLD